MKLKTLVVNGVVAALYIAVTFFIQPLAFMNVQFRVSEIFNHLVVFNKKYMIGIVAGVFLSNLFFSPIKYDMFIGTAQSVLALAITILSARFIKGVWGQMILNSIAFTASMFIIAWEMQWFNGVPFFFGWLTAGAGELAVMLIGMPVIYLINKRLNFEKQV